MVLSHLFKGVTQCGVRYKYYLVENIILEKIQLGRPTCAYLLLEIPLYTTNNLWKWLTRLTTLVLYYLAKIGEIPTAPEIIYCHFFERPIKSIFLELIDIVSTVLWAKFQKSTCNGIKFVGKYHLWKWLKKIFLERLQTSLICIPFTTLWYRVW